MTVTTIASGVHVNLNLIEAFLLVSEHRSFRRAAAALNRSNSTLSGQVRQLEEQLGVQLFERSTRSLRLTDAGAALYDDAKGAYSQVRLALQRASGRADSARSITIACTIALSWRLMPPVLTRFSQRYGAISVDVAEMRTADMRRPLLSGDIAFGIGQACHDDPDIDCDLVRVDPLVALVPSSYPQSRLSSITIEEFAALPLLVQPAGSPTRRTMEQALRDAGFEPQVKVSGLRFHTLLAMVGAGQGAAAFSRLSSESATERGFRPVPFSGEPMRLELGLLKLRGRTFTRAETALMEAIRQELGG
ncbi:LysR family transcriptional regulator [Mangrovicoccus ximenensis]|uniref:LysR family transcriptional regulator n=1 Tax=Mangrovicoccus ximenensis TaxID=1911570 RepID=UPI000D37132B|nr:LysR family transcriptional regulator [Mangrovicoccus ximenensis]